MANKGMRMRANVEGFKQFSLVIEPATLELAKAAARARGIGASQFISEATRLRLRLELEDAS